MQLAMAYVPWQTWNKTYDAETALDRGTISPELDFPFLGEEVCD
ncbi:MAG TPA: spore coat associated protein CotJA [Firmicutes bacterium]|nr:spore coat associated protein CotJA [Bacillota bacterium]